MSDYVVMVKGRGTAFLGGPPLVKMAIDEIVDDETLGGAEMHSRTSGLSDYLADDEMDATPDLPRHRAPPELAQARPWPERPADPPLLRPRGAARVRVGRPAPAVRRARGHRPGGRRLPVRGVQAALREPTRVRLGLGPRVSRSASSATTGSCSRRRPRRPPSSSSSATGSTRRSCSSRTSPASWSGRRLEQRGIIKNGSQLINAVTNSTVPHFVIMVGASYGAGNYGMSGRAFDPRFMFIWPTIASP